jgi:uncharacterized protein involved in response to NO
MRPLITIQAPAKAAPGQPSWKASLELGFRPLYIAGAIWAAASIMLWIFFPQWLTGALQGVAWHAHEMLWGFIATIAVGFLLTAAATWTGSNPIHGPWLAALTGLWVVARCGFLMQGELAFFVASGSELLFFCVSAGALGRVIYKTRNTQNYGVPVLLLALAAADARYLWIARLGDQLQLLRALDIGLLCMASIALLVARRVIPFFAMRAMPGLTVPMQTRSGQIQLIACGAAIICLLTGMTQLLAIFLLIAGAVSLFQVWSWKPLLVRHQPLLWILYTGYAGLGLGLLAAAVHAVDPQIRAALHVHTMAMGGFAILIIGMMTRTALGHLGRPLKLDRYLLAAYWLMLLATALRLLALVPSSYSLWLLQLAALSWMGVFVVYIWRFLPLLIRPKASAGR